MIDTDIHVLYEPWITAVRGGLDAIDRLVDEQPDLGTPEQVLRDIRYIAPAIADPELREATLEAARDVQAQLDLRDAIAAVRTGRQALLNRAALRRVTELDTCDDLLDLVEAHAKSIGDDRLLAAVRALAVQVMAA